MNQGIMNKPKWLFIGFVLSIIFICSSGTKLCADITEVDPSIDFNNKIIIPNGTTTPISLNAAINIMVDDSGDLIPTSSIIISPPENLDLVLSGSPKLTLSGLNGIGIGTLTVNTVGSTTALSSPATGVDNITITSDFLVNGVLRFDIDSLEVGTNTLLISIGSALGTSSDFIGLIPTATATTSNVNTKDLQLSVNLNNGTTSTNIGNIALLAEPEITGATLMDSTTVNLLFNVEVGTSSIKSENFLISNQVDGSSAVTAFSASQQNTNDNKNIIVSTNASFDFDKTPTITLVANSIRNIDDTDETKVSNSKTKPFPIKKDNAAIDNIVITKTTVGTRKEAGSKSLDTNIFSATFNLNTSGQPLKFKLVRESDTPTNAPPLDTGENIGINNSAGLTAKTSGLDVTREDSVHNDGDEFNFDVFVLEGDKNTAGEVTVDFVLGSTDDAFINSGELDGMNINRGAATATAINIGDEVDIAIVASVDNFTNVIKSNPITVDKKGPSLITTGDNSPVSTSLTQIKLTFDEKLNPLTAENVANWSVGEGDDIQKHTISKVSIGTESTNITINTSSSFTENATDVNVSVHKYGIPTVDVEDMFHNPVFGTTTIPLNNSEFTVIGTVSATTNTNSSNFLASSTVQGNEDVSNNANLVEFVFTSKAAISIDTIYIQAFDSTAGFGTPQSSKQTGNSLTSETGGINITESDAGLYKGTIKLNENLTSHSIMLWIVVSQSEPIAESDWENKIKSNVFNVDNTTPTVLETTRYNSATNSVVVNFSEGMNAVELAKDANFPNILNITSGGNFDVSSIEIAAEKNSATYVLQQQINEVDVYVADFDEKTIDDAGNPLNNTDNIGVDRVEFSFTSDSDPTPTPAVGTTPIPTPTSTPIPTPTPTPLIAEFRALDTTGAIPLKVQFIDESTGNPIDWFWDFGDGELSKVKEPSHVYEIPGIYTVSLTIIDQPRSSTETKIDFVTAEGPDFPKANFEIGTTSGQVPFEVEFTDTSTPEGEIDTWLWNFGDGETSTEQDPKHTYTKVGRFNITLTISNVTGENTSLTKSVTASLPPKPVAEFTIVNAETKGNAPFEVKFIDTSTPLNKIDTWLWIFGDGESSNEQNPVHVYKERGRYSVELVVGNLTGFANIKKDRLIKVRR